MGLDTPKAIVIAAMIVALAGLFLFR